MTDPQDMTQAENEYWEGMCEQQQQRFARLPWWRKDKLGWPIETVKGRRVLNLLRIVCQNIRKVTG